MKRVRGISLEDLKFICKAAEGYNGEKAWACCKGYRIGASEVVKHPWLAEHG
jgi:hypothetical protein